MLTMKTVCRIGCVNAWLAWCAVATAQPGIIAGPIAHNGHQYYVLIESTWTTAEAAAVSLGGHLVTINDATENAWVHATLGAFIGPNDSLWIGLNDAAVEGQYVWSSGQPVAYLNWYTGEPSGSSEDYVHMYMSNGKWNDNTNAAAANTVFGTVEVESGCYADCTQDGVLTVADFGCFQTKFVAQDPFADCNADGSLTVADFGCFQTRFVAGCP